MMHFTVKITLCTHIYILTTLMGGGGGGDLTIKGCFKFTNNALHHLNYLISYLVWIERTMFLGDIKKYLCGIFDFFFFSIFFILNQDDLFIYL